MTITSIAILLLTPHFGAVAFHSAPITPSAIVPHHGNRKSKWNKPFSDTALNTSTSSSSSSSLPTASSLESILDDGKGHINSELARAIYQWEMAHRESSLLQPSDDSSYDNETEGKDVNDGRPIRRRTKEKRQFSTRDGLRLVDELARDVLQSLNLDANDAISPSSTSTSSSTASSPSNILSYNDLVQEGMIALLRSMSTYDNYLRSQPPSKTKTKPSPSSSSSDTSFEQYAKRTIRSSLLHFLATSSRPIRLPSSLPAVLRRADAAASELRLRLGREPTLLQVARAVGEDPDKLASYRRLHRRANRFGGGGGKGGVAGPGGGAAFVSVEDGVETYDPTLTGVGVGMDGVRLESVTEEDTASSSSSSSVSNDEESLVSPSRAKSIPSEHDLSQINIREDDWDTQPPERIVAPLRDLLMDTEEINNPLSYTHHYLLNESLDRFLAETLSERELEVIQWRFGLVDSKHGGRGWKFGEICERTGMEREEVVRIATEALEKLRGAAKKRDRNSRGGEEEEELGHLDDPPHLAYWEDDDPYVEVSL